MYLPFGLFSETVSIDLFFPLNGPYFLFLYVPCVFVVLVVEQQTFESNNVITPKIRFSHLAGVCWFCVLFLV